MFTNVGVARSSIVVSILILGASIFPTAVIQAFGNRWRGAKTITGLDQEQVADSKESKSC
jgi:hypothetical protein